MKNGKMKKAALLGLSAGVLMSAQPGLEAEEHSSINMDYVLAKPKCKAHGGCGGLTASSDHHGCGAATAYRSHGCGGLTASRDQEDSIKYQDEETQDEEKDKEDTTKKSK